MVVVVEVEFTITAIYVNNNGKEKNSLLSPFIYLYNILGWSSFPSIRPVIRPVIQVPHPWMKKMMEREDDDDSWRRPQFIQLFLCGQQQVQVEAADKGRHLLSVCLFFFLASRKVNFVGFLFHVLHIGSCSAYQWRSHGGGMSRFLFSSSSSAG